MTILEQLIETLIGAILSSVLPFLQQQANAPTTATEAQNDPNIATRAQSALDQYDNAQKSNAQHAAAKDTFVIVPNLLASTPVLPAGPVSRTLSPRLSNR